MPAPCKSQHWSRADLTEDERGRGYFPNENLVVTAVHRHGPDVVAGYPSSGPVCDQREEVGSSRKPGGRMNLSWARAAIKRAAARIAQSDNPCEGL